MKNFITHWIKALRVTVVALLTAVFMSNAHSADLGITVNNVADISFKPGGGEAITMRTPVASFMVEAARTPSTIDFFRYAPNTEIAQNEFINGSAFAPNGSEDGPFENIGAPLNGGATIDLSSAVPLTPALTYASGELMFLRVIDLGQNGNADKIETVTVVLTSNTGDMITLMLYESGKDTGEFWAYVPSTRDNSSLNDNMLTTKSEGQLTAKYTDKFDETETSVDTALIDPYGRVFNSLTGELIDNALVTIIDNATGSPATVYGVDGMSLFPSSVTTGQSIYDDSGLLYELRAGEFRFPVVQPGSYSIEVVTPNGFVFTSEYQQEDFQFLDNGPFKIGDDSSYGKTFNIALPGPLQFDIPIDAQTDIVLTKTSNPNRGDVGDFIRYNVKIENSGTVPSRINLLDFAPTGFRYVEGSSLLDGSALEDPDGIEQGHDLLFNIDTLLPAGESYDLSYVMQIGANAGLGEKVNSAVTVDINGEETSNIARAAVMLEEDLLRSTSTILGRVTENSCDANEDWAREISKGDGVEGVRLYMETGAYVVTDEDGLYHFQGVSTGSHVVQVDEATLPQGYQVMMCEENTQYAGRSRSKFVDVIGGGIWRANFYLKRTGEIAQLDTAEVYNDITDYKNYDLEWLNTQSSDLEWVYPLDSRTPSISSVNIGIKHEANQRVKLSLNGHDVALTNVQPRINNTARTTTLSRWRGVDILDGRNVFIAKLMSSSGEVLKTLKREIHYVETIARATPVVDQSVLIADGRTKPIIAIRIEDEAGRPVHAGRKLRLDIDSPYAFEREDRLDNSTSLTQPLTARSAATVGADGIARIALEPTLQTGKVTVTVKLDDGREVDVSMYIQPEKRDWIIVGLAEGSAGLDSLSARAADLSDGDVIMDGRVAFFAKGLIKGDWLMTLAVDTAKSRDSRDTELFDQIDPNAYYTLYGDRTYEDHEAQSSYPVYLKLEKKTFSAMFGDYKTGMTDADLTRYSRNLSGLKTEYIGKRFDVVGFAAETNQGFAKDELPAIGISTGYATSYAPVTINSEVITIETRDRFRPDVVLDSVPMVRNLDYTIDYLTGKIVFRLPVDSTDSALNPKTVVVDYETLRDSERNMTYGGRATAKFKDDRIKASVTYIHEEGRADLADGKQDVIGLDTQIQIGEGTLLKAEIAHSETQASGETVSANAYMAELVHTSDKLALDAYAREEEAGFGTGQTNSNTSGLRRIGARAAYRLSENIQEDTGHRTTRNLSAQAYKETNLGSKNSRVVSEALLSQEGEAFGASAGLRSVSEDIVGVGSTESVLAVASARLTNTRHGFTVTATHEQPLSDDEQSTLFPQRTSIGVNKTLTDKADVTLRHELLEGDGISSENTVLGVSYNPWAGTDVNVQTDMMTQDSAKRLGATIGVDQQWQVTEKVSAAVGVSQRSVLSGSGVMADITADAPVSPLEVNEDFLAIYAGVGYQDDVMSASARVESFASEQLDSQGVVLGVARELSEELSVAGKASHQTQDYSNSSDPSIGPSQAMQTDVRGVMAWRPRNEDTVVLNRLDLSIENSVDGTQTSKIVNNFAANTMINDRTQATFNYGVKYAETAFDDTQYSSTSHLLGGEVRFDLTERIDVGVQASALITDDGKSASYSYGPSVGFSPVDNTWVTIGYNVDGYRDDDFAAAKYSNDGAYIKLRWKFDQKSAEMLLKQISFN